MEAIQEQNEGWVPKEIAINWLSQMTEILMHLESKKVLHRDAHFGNFMIDGKTLILTDFGDSLYLEDGVLYPSNERYTYHHPWISAPELQSDKPVTFNADIFTLAA